MQQMDIALFNTGGEPDAYFGNYYAYDIEGTSNNTMAFVVFVNATSQDAVATYGAYIH